MCEDIAGGSELSVVVFILFGVIRTHFLACEDVAGGSSSQGEKTLFSRVKRMSCMHASMGVVRPHCQPLTYSHLLMTFGC